MPDPAETFKMKITQNIPKVIPLDLYIYKISIQRYRQRLSRPTLP